MNLKCHCRQDNRAYAYIIQRWTLDILFYFAKCMFLYFRVSQRDYNRFAYIVV